MPLLDNIVLYDVLNDLFMILLIKHRANFEDPISSRIVFKSFTFQTGNVADNLKTVKATFI